MSIAITAIAAILVGLFLFALVLPNLSRILIARVDKSKRMNIFQKRKIINALEWIADGPVGKPRQKGTALLSISYFVLLGIQHYFLYMGNAAGARIIVAGMFFMLVIHVLISE
jgi:hypothetical protein